MTEKHETVIIGGGQGGLATSYFLRQHGREHIVLEQAAQAGNVWRNERWDSFTLVTPNWSFRLPGAEYQGSDPDGFMPRAEIVAVFERYIARYQLPVHYQTRVTAVESDPVGKGFLIYTEETTLAAQNVVVATGLFQQAKQPQFSAKLSAAFLQISSSQYRNPDALPPGAVLVVGSAQSGCQIAEELYQHGRKVYLSTGTTGRAPRRYRGKDTYFWLHQAGFLDRTVNMLPSPNARFAGNPHLSGRNGGHTLNLHQFARDGVVLLGRIQNAAEDKIWLAPDLNENLAKADQTEDQLVKLIDGYIERSGISAPLETLPVLKDGFHVGEITEIDLGAAGITVTIWATGFRFDFSLVKFPIFDSAGFPIQDRGLTSISGIYFVGMPWLNAQKSGLLLGVGETAEHIAAAINR